MGQVEIRGVPELELTDNRKFAARADAGELPGASIVVLIPINRPSKSGGSAAADVHRA